jgi:hypothetical protein
MERGLFPSENHRIPSKTSPGDPNSQEFRQKPLQNETIAAIETKIPARRDTPNGEHYGSQPAI